MKVNISSTLKSEVASGVCVQRAFRGQKRGELHDFSTGPETTKQIFMLTKVNMICFIFPFPYSQQFPNTLKHYYNLL